MSSLTAASYEKTCLYELLGIEQSASAADIKKAYRLQARKYHPDKNGNTEAATRHFQAINNAHTVLSDPHERAWYDDHRDQILFGNDDANGNGGVDGDGTPSNQAFDAVSYMSPFAFRGFSSDESNTKSFWSVYGRAFAEIDRQEELASKRRPQGKGKAKLSEFVSRPAFGSADTPEADVKVFYASWRSFSTRKNFSWKDEWDTRDAPARRVRRAMEKENTKKRNAAKRKFVDSIHNLVRFVSRRDPRVKAYREREVKAREEREAKMAADREAKKNEKRRLMDEWRVENSKREAERRLKEASAIAAGETMDKEFNLADELIGASMEQDGNESRDSGESDEEEYHYTSITGRNMISLHECVACKRTFKTEKQWLNHERSRKHKEAVKQLRKELEADDALVGEGTSNKIDGPSGAKRKSTIDNQVDENKEEADYVSNSDEEEVDFGPQKALTKKQKRRQKKFEEMQRKLEEASMKKMNKKKKKKKNKKNKKQVDDHDHDGHSSSEDVMRAHARGEEDSGDGEQPLNAELPQKKLTKKQMRRAKLKLERQEKERLEKERELDEARNLAAAAAEGMTIGDEGGEDDEHSKASDATTLTKKKKKKKKKRLAKR